MIFGIKSSAFTQGHLIPKKYSCEGPDVSVPLAWTDPPAGTKSFALIAGDPDAPGGTWVHWVLYDLPSEARGLPENVPKQETLKDGTKQGLNDFERIGYGGPCPSPGKPHRYFFKLYALDKKLGLATRATKPLIMDAMKNHILGEAQLMGMCKR